MTETRIERDTMGEVALPVDALYGAQTQRAVENFPISGEPMPPEFIHALGLVKLAAARVNRELGLLPPDVAEAIERAARAVADGELDAQFPIDVFQTGSGTSSNMNANEVIAAVASSELGRRVHPNDEVNLGQSSNDVIPTVLHVSAVMAIEQRTDAGAALPARRAAPESRRIRRRGQDRPHPPDGRRADPAGPGVQRLRAADRARHRAHRGDAAGPARAGDRRHGGRHRAQHPSRVRGAGGARALRPDRARRSAKRRTTSRRRAPATPTSSPPAR